MAKAPIGKRVAAYIIDVLLSMVLMFAVGIVATIVVVVLSTVLGRNGGGIIAIISMLMYLAVMLVAVLYLLLRDGLNNGASYGKKFMKLKVVKMGLPAKFMDSLLRNITFMVPMLGFIDLLVPFVDSEGQRIGDKIAKTQVVEV